MEPSLEAEKCILRNATLLVHHATNQATRRKGERAHTNRGLTKGGLYGPKDDAPIESVLCSKALLSPLPTAAGSKCLSGDASLRSDPKGVMPTRA